MGVAFGGHEALEDFYRKETTKLGEGSFATVWRGVNKFSGAFVAIKQFDIQSSGAGRNRAAYEKEVKLLSSVKDENVVKLLGFFAGQSHCHLVLDYCDGGDLGDEINGHCNSLKMGQVKNYTRQILAAINALHAASIIHRDVKPDNFLIAICEDGTHILKLADFGIADILPYGELLHAKCGTPGFMAPEQHILPGGSGYGFAVDLWAAGIILFMFLETGRHPFKRGSHLDIAKLMKGKPLTRVAASAVFEGRDVARGKELCNTLLSARPDDRLTAAEALHHSWILNDTTWARPSHSEVTRGSQLLGGSENQQTVVLKDTGWPLKLERPDSVLWLSEFFQSVALKFARAIFGQNSAFISQGTHNVTEITANDTDKETRMQARTFMQVANAHLFQIH